MHVDVGRRRLAGGEQHGGPVHAVEPEDVLADEVVDVGPPVGEARPVGAVADRRGVVDERVVPDVEDVRVVPRHRHTPVERAAADADVAEAVADQAQRLVALAVGLHRVGSCGRASRAAAARTPRAGRTSSARGGTRPAGRGSGTGRSRRGRLVRREVVLGVVGLARHAVQAFVGVLVDVAVGVHLGQQRLHRDVVPRLGGADEVVVADVEQRPRPRGSARRWRRPARRLGPAASAERCTFRPCSSVPVRKNTSSPSSRCHRASASAVTVV